MAKYLAAIDQGTTSTRCLVFGRDGQSLGAAQKAHAQLFPRPGWVEHDPLEIWHHTLEVLSAALGQAGIAAHDLAALGVTNQRETTVLWDRRTGKPLHHALVWQDTRVDTLVADYLQRGGRDRYRAKTGLPLATYFSALKLQWLLREVPGARELAVAGDALFGTIDTWLIWNLTGGVGRGLHLTDVTNASRTQLMDLVTCDWDEDLMRDFDIPRAVLPRIVPSSEVYGEAQVAPVVGVSIAGILGDQQAALVGQTCFAPGESKNTYGTGCFLLMNTGAAPVQSKAGLITTVAYQFGAAAPCYALEGSVAIAGALVQWLRDNLRLIESSAEIETLASEVEDNGDVYFVPAFSGLYAPHWRETARGIVAGLTRFANRGHLARAALEATAFQTRDVLTAMARDAQMPIMELRVDGGMVGNELLMQFQADILNLCVVRPLTRETTALGAAYAAGLAVGVWSSPDELKSHWAIDKRWEPRMSDARRMELCLGWQKAIDRSLGWHD